MATPNIFQLNTLDVLGSGFISYLSDIRALSLTNPRSYFLLRKEISTKIVDDEFCYNQSKADAMAVRLLNNL